MIELVTAAANVITSIPPCYIDPWGIPPGVWLIFGVIGLPVYVAFLGWFLGKPRNLTTSALGSVVFLGLTTALWLGLFATTMVLRLVFF